MTCTFFGHKDTPDEVKDKLRQTIITLIEEKGVTNFYIGNHGNFDRMVLSVLKELSKLYPQIRYSVVLAYLTQNTNEDYSNTIFPIFLSQTISTLTFSNMCGIMHKIP